MKQLFQFVLFQFTLVLMLSLPGQSFAQITASSLSPDSLENIPLNRFFFYSPAGFRDAVENEVCVKTNADLQAFFKLVADYHKAETRTTEDGTKRVWYQVDQPMRFYLLHSVAAEIEERNGYQLLRFYTFSGKKESKNPLPNKIKMERRLGVKPELRYLQTLLNHQLYGTPLHALFNIGSSGAYYLSRQEAQAQGLNTLYTVSRSLEDATSGEKNTWDVQRIRFSENRIDEEWDRVESPAGAKRDLPAFLQSATFEHGQYYNFSDGKLRSYGENGRGSLINHQIFHFGDSASVNLSTDNAPNASEPYCATLTRYGKRNQADMRIHFGCFQDDAFWDMTEDFGELLQFLNQERSPGTKADTVLYHKGVEGELFSTSPSDYEMRKGQIPAYERIKEFKHQDRDLYQNYASYQAYVGQEKMEDWIRKKMGFLPPVLCIEMYERGAYLFQLDSKNQLYHFQGSMLLD